MKKCAYCQKECKNLSKIFLCPDCQKLYNDGKIEMVKHDNRKPMTPRERSIWFFTGIFSLAAFPIFQIFGIIIDAFLIFSYFCLLLSVISFITFAIGFVSGKKKKAPTHFPAQNIKSIHASNDRQNTHIETQVRKFNEKLLSIPNTPIVLSGEKAKKLKLSEMPELVFSNITKANFEKIGDFIVIDTETTGISKKCSIIEVSALRCKDFEPIELFTTLVNPQKEIPTEITNITGISIVPPINMLVNTFCVRFLSFFK